MTRPEPAEPCPRRATPLADDLRRALRRDGADVVSVHDCMAACVAHYYARGRVFGRDGDFVTAPEISQVFGEVIGLWCAVVWQQMGCPRAFNLVEIGPGRATMLRDAVRALRVVPSCLAAARLCLIEPSAALRDQQAATLATLATLPFPLGAAVAWYPGIADVPAGPTIVLGNEYVDALPVHQFVRGDAAWHTRCVAVGADDILTFAVGPPLPAAAPTPPAAQLLAALAPYSTHGDIVERRDLGPDLIGLGRFRADGMALLLLDYGHTASAIGDTLQAVRNHRYESPLCAPGEADLSAQVDFDDLRRQLTAQGWATGPALPQAAFLSSLGICERAARLMSANPAQANAIEMAVGRLLSPTGMGGRFQVLGARSPHLPPLPGLPG